jgi:hypothetical protein
MRRVLIYSAAAIVVYAAAAWILVLPPFRPSPVFYENVPLGGQSYTCNGGAGPSIFIRFEGEGKVAVVRAGSYNLRLTYKTSDFMNDVYESGPWRLTLDPEANLTGPRSLVFGNCH